jgi:serine/threonine protein kinase
MGQCLSTKQEGGNSSTTSAKSTPAGTQDTTPRNNATVDVESSSFLVDSKSLAKGRVEDVYEIGEELGRGTFSIVKEGINRKNRQLRVALKFIDKKFIDKDDIVLLRREIEIMKKVQHENVRTWCHVCVLFLSLLICQCAQWCCGVNIFFRCWPSAKFMRLKPISPLSWSCKLLFSTNIHCS